MVSGRKCLLAQLGTKRADACGASDHQEVRRLKACSRQKNPPSLRLLPPTPPPAPPPAPPPPPVCFQSCQFPASFASGRRQNVARKLFLGSQGRIQDLFPTKVSDLGPFFGSSLLLNEFKKEKKIQNISEQFTLFPILFTFKDSVEESKQSFQNNYFPNCSNPCNF